MNLHGKQILAGELSAESPDTFHGVNPRSGEKLDPPYHEATAGEIDRALTAAAESFDAFRQSSPETRAQLLDTLAEEVLALDDELLERAAAETAHPLPRCRSERDRVVGQARLFAELVREGSWADARIDRGDPGRQPLPRPDLRSLLQPVGPVAVFGASNFPIAISVLGSDTVSAFACGCPVVVKGHPAHPGTCELAALAVNRAVEKCGLPPGIFSLVHGTGHGVGANLVEHPETAAVAFTGSLAGGRALFDLANSRPDPIPFYAEMGSANPVFLLPGALRERGEEIATGFVQALTLGVGQFCTNPGLVFGLDSPEWTRFREAAAAAVRTHEPQTMLHAGIHRAYANGLESRRGAESLALLAQSDREASPERSEASACLFLTDAAGFAEHPECGEELFGPASTLVECASPEELAAFAERMEGSLTATVHGTKEDLETHRALVSALEKKAGRLIFNGYPVGLEVNHSIHHGGPYPATCHSHFTSIGTRAIQRFVRPVCYQDWPASALPEELQDGNPRGIWRLVDGEWDR